VKKLPKLNLPSYTFRFKKSHEGDTLIFDEVRKKWFVLTPEEWVRQNLNKFLIKSKCYPESMFQIESGLMVNRNKKRSDVVVFKNGSPYILIECKAPNIKLNELVFDQATTYNLKLNCPYIILSNGLKHLSVNVSVFPPKFQEEFPVY